MASPEDIFKALIPKRSIKMMRRFEQGFGPGLLGKAVTHVNPRTVYESEAHTRGHDAGWRERMLELSQGPLFTYGGK